MIRYTSLLLLLFITYVSPVFSQTVLTKSIKLFGAKGDGKTNDTDAFFKAAAFFNQRGGNGTLVIPRGTYIVGKQRHNDGTSNGYAYTSDNILDFKNINNLVIEGLKGSVIQYAANLKFGSFDPVTEQKFDSNSRVAPVIKYAAVVGNCIALNNCRNVTIKSLTLNGNNKAIQFGGVYGDIGIQLTHSGVFIQNSHAVTVDNITADYFGLDGIGVSNVASTEPDDINISNCNFEYNCRQGLSWVGGNNLSVKNCQFNHTGRSGYHSAPCAGVDIEAEINKINGGRFDNCQFIDNYGCGLVTGGGVTSDCTFNNCTFWGTTNWSVWVTAPSFTFTGCKIYGSIVHGINTVNDADATRYIKCHFEDKPYNGQPPYGKFLIECDGARKITFDSCTFVTNGKKIAWLNTANATTADERGTIRNSNFIVTKNADPKAVFYLYGVNFNQNTVEYKDPAAKENGVWAGALPCCITAEEKGNTKVIYDK